MSARAKIRIKARGIAAVTLMAAIAIIAHTAGAALPRPVARAFLDAGVPLNAVSIVVQDTAATSPLFVREAAEPRTAAPRCAHHWQVEALHLLFRERQANQPAPIDAHEVDRFGRDRVCGHTQVAFVFAILVVDQDDHLAGANVIDRGLNAAQRLGADVERSHGFGSGRSGHDGRFT